MQYDQAQEQSPAILPRHTQAHGGRVTRSMARAQPCPHTTRCRPSRAAPLTRHSPIHIKAPSAGRTHGSTARHGVQTEGVPQTPSPTPHTAEDAAAPHPDLKGLDMGRPRGRREAAHLRAGPPPPCCPHRGSAVRGRPQLWEQRAVGRAPAKVGQSREARPGLASPHRQHWGTAGPRRPRTKAAVGPRRCEGEGEKGCGGGGGGGHATASSERWGLAGRGGRRAHNPPREAGGWGEAGEGSEAPRAPRCSPRSVPAQCAHKAAAAAAPTRVTWPPLAPLPPPRLHARARPLPRHVTRRRALAHRLLGPPRPHPHLPASLRRGRASPLTHHQRAPISRPFRLPPEPREQGEGVRPLLRHVVGAPPPRSPEGGGWARPPELRGEGWWVRCQGDLWRFGLVSAGRSV